MRCVASLLLLVCFVSLSPGQYVEATIPLPDSLSGFRDIGALLYHSPNNTIYVGGNDSFLIAVDASTNSKLAKVSAGSWPHSLLCSDPTGNKIYSTGGNRTTLTVIDGATNLLLKTIPVDKAVTDLVYNEFEDKLYCGNAQDSLVRVIDCAGDSVVARIHVSLWPGAFCYNPQLNRVYCTHSGRDEVTVIDCATDTVVSTVWVRGVEPVDICYDSATSCVYTANTVSNTVSVIDCSADTVLRILAAGFHPEVVAAGPPGRVYCANYSDSSVTVISSSGVKTVRTVQNPAALSYDPVNNKVYCAGDYRAVVTVIDAAPDTVLANVEAGSSTVAVTLCYNPAGNCTYIACSNEEIDAIDGVSDVVEATLAVGVCSPGPLCYNTVNNRLYCLDRQNGLLFIVDGDSNRVLKTIETCRTSGSPAIVWNQTANKVYLAGDYDSTVSVIDCESDSVVADVVTGQPLGPLCCSDDGKVYVPVDSGVAVIDGGGDTVRSVVPLPTGRFDYPSFCYDRVDGKIYVGKSNQYGIGVIDVASDSLVGTILVPYSVGDVICWNQNHDKLYASGWNYDSLVVIDCARDTILKRLHVPREVVLMYNDSVCDKVYCYDGQNYYLRIISAATDTFYASLYAGGQALLDNGKRGPANRLYSTDYWEGEVAVVSGYKTDSILRQIEVGKSPGALAWNPTQSRMYVSNSGSSSISVIRDTWGTGVEEREPQASNHILQATIVRGVLFLPEASSHKPQAASLLNIAGRKVRDLLLGANDVRALAPGVYFIRDEGQGTRDVGWTRKVVIQR